MKKLFFLERDEYTFAKFTRNSKGGVDLSFVGSQVEATLFREEEIKGFDIWTNSLGLGEFFVKQFEPRYSVGVTEGECISVKFNSPFSYNETFVVHPSGLYKCSEDKVVYFTRSEAEKILHSLRIITNNHNVNLTLIEFEPVVQEILERGMENLEQIKSVLPEKPDSLFWEQKIIEYYEV